MATKFIARRPLNLAQQAAGIRQTLPWFEVALAGRLLVARGTLVPNLITRKYRVRIEYEGNGNRPEVYVEEPKLLRRPQEPDEPIPHTYESTMPGKERPCAFYPAMDWDGTRPIATSVVPWLMSWLFDYEVWHATGHWHGGGLHPTLNSRSAKRLRRKAAT